MKHFGQSWPVIGIIQGFWFGPGPDGAERGRPGGRGVCFSTLLAANFEPGLDGVRCLGVEFDFLSFTHWPLDGRPSYARSLVPTPSKTVDQTLPR